MVRLYDGLNDHRFNCQLIIWYEVQIGFVNRRFWQAGVVGCDATIAPYLYVTGSEIQSKPCAGAIGFAGCFNVETFLEAIRLCFVLKQIDLFDEGRVLQGFLE
jgi:hypothetical protein